MTDLSRYGIILIFIGWLIAAITTLFWYSSYRNKSLVMISWLLGIIGLVGIYTGSGLAISDIICYLRGY